MRCIAATLAVVGALLFSSESAWAGLGLKARGGAVLTLTSSRMTMQGAAEWRWWSERDLSGPVTGRELDRNFEST